MFLKDVQVVLDSLQMLNYWFQCCWASTCPRSYLGHGPLPPHVQHLLNLPWMNYGYYPGALHGHASLHHSEAALSNATLLFMKYNSKLITWREPQISHQSWMLQHNLRTKGPNTDVGHHTQCWDDPQAKKGWLQLSPTPRICTTCKERSSFQEAQTSQPPSQDTQQRDAHQGPVKDI